ncbi:MAG: hypothetical protein KF878_00305 [Planctomycetes bacterium]|nr:hypothetical protein [Planctomycetota bacterium]
MTAAVAAPAPEPTPDRRRDVVLRAGVRFYNRALRCYCAVYAIVGDAVYFRTVDVPPADYLETDVPLDVALAAVMDGHWDVRP